jgi:hypothetical protein
MILAKVQTSTKQRAEFRLLMSIRFACLMALAKGHQNPMDCPRVQTRTAELEKHFAYNHPSPAFYSQFIDHAGELGPSFSLRFTDPKQGLYGNVTVWSNEAASTNVYQLLPTTQMSGT